MKFMANLFQPSVIRAALWDAFQKLFGANKEKCRIYREAVRCQPGESIIDFGCATGITAEAFNDCNYLGVDIDQGAIEWAKHKYRHDENIDFICCDVETLKNHRFSRALCAGTGHHLSDSEIQKYHELLGAMVQEPGTVHFIDIIKTKSDNVIMRLLMAIDQGKYIRNAHQYEELFSNLKNLRVVNTNVIRAEGWFTKASFISIKLVSTRV